MLEIPLDHNFPVSIIRCLAEHLDKHGIRLLPIAEIDERLPDLDDRPLILSLHQLGYTGLVTANYRMLHVPAEVAAILATGISVFAIEAVGDDPLRATGALLLDLPSAVKAIESGRGQIVWFRPRRPTPQTAWDVFLTAVRRVGEDPATLLDQVRVGDIELSTPVLA